MLRFADFSVDRVKLRQRSVCWGLYALDLAVVTPDLITIDGIAASDIQHVSIAQAMARPACRDCFC